MTDWLRSLCDELAENGVIAIAPDFLNGQKFEDADAASKAVSAVTPEQVTETARTMLTTSNRTVGHFDPLPIPETRVAVPG